jgi:peptidoglycan/LPS O-acetylase OafA/YrhL
VSDVPAVLPFAGDPGRFRLGYRPWLDGMRGIAVLLVLAFHFFLLPGGFLGVDVFFVLSGFLITSLLIDEWQTTGRIHLGKFYLRRILRLAPALAAVLIGCLVFVMVFQPERLPTYRAAMLVAACYLSNWPSLIQVPMGEIAHTWSLSVEEQFYLIWPLLLLGLLKLRLSRAWVAGIVIAGIAASATVRFSLWTVHQGSPDFPTHFLRMYTGLDTRADALLVGCLLGLAASWNWLPRSKSAGRVYGVLAILAVAGLGYLLLFKKSWHAHYFLGLFTLVAVMVAALVARMLVAPSRWERRVLELRPLVFTGKISYGLYLYHYPVLFYLKWPLGWDHLGNIAVIAAITMALTLASYFLIEQPFLKLKSRFRAEPLKRGEADEGRRAA